MKRKFEEENSKDPEVTGDSSSSAEVKPPPWNDPRPLKKKSFEKCFESRIAVNLSLIKFIGLMNSAKMEALLKAGANPNTTWSDTRPEGPLPWAIKKALEKRLNEDYTKSIHRQIVLLLSYGATDSQPYPWDSNNRRIWRGGKTCREMIMSLNPDLYEQAEVEKRRIK
jgi:hypothetical protein